MSKFKITVETKSRSKVIVEIDTGLSLQAIKEQMAEVYANHTIQVAEHFFNASNVNYIAVEQVE